MKYEELTHSSGIYRIIFDNQKSYIGKTVDFKRRMREHISRDLTQHPHLAISRAINKHEIIDYEVLEEIPIDAPQEFFNERERYWIAQYHSFENGYNETPGGDGSASGIDNQASKLSTFDLEKIYFYLKNTNRTYRSIANEIEGASIKIISNINQGYHYRNPDIDYPIRQVRAEHYGFENKHSAFYAREQDFYALVSDLKTTTIPLKDLQIKYNIGSSTMCNVNQGKGGLRLDDENYPLRKTKTTPQARIFSEEELKYIKQQLEGTTTMQEIASVLNTDRKKIGEINSGIRQNNPLWDYPLRKNRLKTGPKPVSTILGSEEQGSY